MLPITILIYPTQYPESPVEGSFKSVTFSYTEICLGNHPGSRPLTLVLPVGTVLEADVAVEP